MSALCHVCIPRFHAYSVSVAEGVDVEESECLLAVPQLHGWNFSCMIISPCTLQLIGALLPLIILQKIHEAAIL